MLNECYRKLLLKKQIKKYKHHESMKSKQTSLYALLQVLDHKRLAPLLFFLLFLPSEIN